MSGSPGPETRRLERRLFLLLVGLVLLVFVFLVADRRLPRGHDTFLSYAVGYFGMCHASQGGGPAHWTPYLAQGSESQAGVPLGLLPSLWPASGRFFAGTDCLALFYFGFFFNELLLLTGTWMLARRRFADPRTVFFVSAAVMGANLWIDQSGNVALIAPLPLLLCWIHDFLERGSRLKLFLAAHVLCLQLVGGYGALLLALVLGIYFGAHAALFPSRWREWFSLLRPRRTDVLWAAGIAAAMLLPLAGLGRSEEVVFSSFGRSASGSVGLDSFLTYGGMLNPVRYLDAPLGLSPSLDVGVFCGTIPLGLAVLAVFLRPGRDVGHLLAVLLLVLLVSAGFLGLTAALAYAWVPKMAYFRHVTLAATFVRFLLAFLAGYGFDRLAAGRLRGDRRIAVAGGAAAVLAAGLAVLSFLPRESIASFMKVLETGHPGFSFRHDLAAGPGGSLLLGAAALAAASLASALLAARSGRFPLAPLVAFVLAANTVHLFGWKLAMFHGKTVRMTPEQQAMQRIGPIPYLPRRTEDPSTAPRYAALAPALWPYGTEHSLADPYFFMDLPVPRARITTWQRPLDELLRAWGAQPLRDPPVPLAAWSDNRLHLPGSHPAIPRVVGLSVDKLQVFRRAHRVSPGEETARLLRHPAFRGDLLFIPGTGPPPPDLSANDRLPSPCEVVEFDADHIVVRTRAPEGAWLAYADVWHPRWKAEINGQPVAVERANLAYKAVPLRAGANVVTFRFEPDPSRVAYNRVLAGVLLSWTLLIAGLSVRAGAGR